MKVLLDTCIAINVLRALLADGIDVEWTGSWQPDPGDETILDYAYQHQRILITLDKDFGMLAIQQGKPHAGIVRLTNLSTFQQISVCRSILTQYHETLSSGAILTTDGNRVRIRITSQ